MKAHKKNRRLGVLVVLVLVVFCSISKKAVISQTSCDQSSYPTCDGGCQLGDICVDDSENGVCVCQSFFPPAGTDISPTTWHLRLLGFGAGTIDVKIFGEVEMHQARRLSIVTPVQAGGAGGPQGVQPERKPMSSQTVSSH